MKTIPDLPKALYGCEEQGCAEEESHFPEDLWLILNPPQGWDPDGTAKGAPMRHVSRIQTPRSGRLWSTIWGWS